MEALKEHKPWVTEFAQLAVKIRDCESENCSRAEHSSDLDQMMCHTNPILLRKLVFACLEELGDDYSLGPFLPPQVTLSNHSERFEWADSHDSATNSKDAEEDGLTGEARQNAEAEKLTKLQDRRDFFSEFQKGRKLDDLMEDMWAIIAEMAAELDEFDSDDDYLADEEDDPETYSEGAEEDESLHKDLVRAEALKELALQYQQENISEFEQDCNDLGVAVEEPKEFLAYINDLAALDPADASGDEYLAGDEHDSDIDTDSDSDDGYVTCEEEGESAFEDANEFLDTSDSEGK